MQRRTFLHRLIHLGGALLSINYGLLWSNLAKAAWPLQSFKTTQFDQIMNELFSGVEWIDSDAIKLEKLPTVAENGETVPIKIISSISDSEKIYLLVEKNPYPLIAVFHLSNQVAPIVSARFKMAESSLVWIIVQAQGQFYRQSVFVKVTQGGCG
jgi:sulfur-oxidizing protein SoxY